jgi:hypothetical protein
LARMNPRSNIFIKPLNDHLDLKPQANFTKLIN